MKTIAHLPDGPTLIVPPSASRESRIQLLLDHISKVKDIPLEPSEFVSCWLKFPLDTRGYRQHCDEAIARALGIDRWSISWGKNYSRRPAYVPMLLRLADIVKHIQASGICRPRAPQSWEPSIVVPSSWPQPVLRLNDRVICESTGAFGSILGLDYLPQQAAWGYRVLVHPAAPTGAGERILFTGQELSRW